MFKKVISPLLLIVLLGGCGGGSSSGGGGATNISGTWSGSITGGIMWKF